MNEVVISFKKTVAEIKAYSELYCNEDGCPLVFKSPKEADDRLLRDGIPEEQRKEMRFIGSIGECPRCGKPLFPSFLPDYKSQCFECDEDFYSFEQKTLDRSHSQGLFNTQHTTGNSSFDLADIFRKD